MDTLSLISLIIAIIVIIIVIVISVVFSNKINTINEDSNTNINTLKTKIEEENKFDKSANEKLESVDKEINNLKTDMSELKIIVDEMKNIEVKDENGKTVETIRYDDSKIQEQIKEIKNDVDEIKKDIDSVKEDVKSGCKIEDVFSAKNLHHFFGNQQTYDNWYNSFDAEFGPRNTTPEEAKRMGENMMQCMNTFTSMQTGYPINGPGGILKGNIFKIYVGDKLDKQSTRINNLEQTVSNLEYIHRKEDDEFKFTQEEQDLINILSDKYGISYDRETLKNKSKNGTLVDYLSNERRRAKEQNIAININSVNNIVEKKQPYDEPIVKSLNIENFAEIIF